VQLLTPPNATVVVVANEVAGTFSPSSVNVAPDTWTAPVVFTYRAAQNSPCKQCRVSIKVQSDDASFVYTTSFNMTVTETPAQPTSAATTKNSPSHLPLIISIAVGGLAAAAIVAAVVILCLRRRRTSSQGKQISYSYDVVH